MGVRAILYGRVRSCCRGITDSISDPTLPLASVWRRGRAHGGEARVKTGSSSPSTPPDTPSRRELWRKRRKAVLLPLLLHFSLTDDISCVSRRQFICKLPHLFTARLPPILWGCLPCLSSLCSLFPARRVLSSLECAENGDVIVMSVCAAAKSASAHRRREGERRDAGDARRDKLSAQRVSFVGRQQGR